MALKVTDNGLAKQPFVAENGINDYCIVIPGSDYNQKAGVQVKAASDDHSAPLLGAIQNLTVVDGEPVQIPVPGQVGKVKLGGTVNRGDFLTATTGGTAIAAAIGGTGYVIGQAGDYGVSGDVIPYLHAPGYLA